MTTTRQATGRRGEQIAVRTLLGRGWSIVARNARTRFGEIDLVARDGDALVFVEVKTLRAGARRGPARPALAVDRRKAARIRSLAGAWLAGPDRPTPYAESIRFDVIGITLRNGAPPEIEHIKGAF